MDYYQDVYSRRINRYGNDFQSRIQGQRQREFENKLLKSVYRVDFIYEGKMQPATLERYRQDETMTAQYLLTRVDLQLPGGTILAVPNPSGGENLWMVYWKEEIQASGYNRYIVLKMTHKLQWKDEKGETHSSPAYLFGKGNAELRQSLRKDSGATTYSENSNSSFFVLPKNPYVKRDTYLEIGEGDFQEGFVVTGMDFISTPGVEFVTIDPVPIRDLTPKPQPEPDSNPDDFYWLEGK